MLTIRFNPEDAKKKYRLQISQGGTGQDTIPKAVEALGGIRRDLINKPGGVVGLDELGFIPQNLIPSDVEFSTPLNLDGPDSIAVGETKQVLITNFDSFTSYTLKFEGITGYRTDDVIYITGQKRGTARLTVNGSVLPVPVVGNMPLSYDIVGGTLDKTLPSPFEKGKYGTTVRVTTNGNYVIGAPGASSDSGRIHVRLANATYRHYVADPGPLTFQATIGVNGALTINSDAPNFSTATLTESAAFNIPERSTNILLQGRGGKGKTTWKEGTPGLGVLAFKDSTVSEDLPARSFISATTVLTTTLENGVKVERTITYLTALNNTGAVEAVTRMGLGTTMTVVEKTIFPNGLSTSTDPVSRSCLANLIVVGNRVTYEMETNNIGATLDSVVIELFKTSSAGGLTQMTVSGWKETVSSVSANGGYFSIPLTKTIRRFGGYVPGFYIHEKGDDTRVAGYSKLLVWAAGTGNPTGYPVPAINATLFEGDYKVLIEITNINTQNNSILTSPFAASESPLLKPIDFGFGIDPIDRDIQWSLLDSSSKNLIKSSAGWIRIDFSDTNIQVQLDTGNNITFATGASYNLVIDKAGSRTSFPMVPGNNSTTGVKTFTVAGYSKKQGALAQVGISAPEESSKTINTVENMQFGSRIAVSDDTNTIVAGVATNPLTGTGQLVIIKNYQLDNASIRRLDTPDSQVQYGALGRVAISTSGQTAVASYPSFNGNKGCVAIYRLTNGELTFKATASPAAISDNSRFGRALALNQSGSSLAVGTANANRVYIYDVGVVIAEQAVIDAPAGYTGFGTELFYSADGNKLAINGRTAQNLGVVFIYEKMNNSWVRRATLNQPSSFSADIDFGKSISADANFNMIAVAAPGSSTLIGHVFLFFNGTDSWEHYKTLQGDNSAIGTYYGSSLSVRPDAQELIVGENAITLTDQKTGQVYTYEGEFAFLT